MQRKNVINWILFLNSWLRSADFFPNLLQVSHISHVLWYFEFIALVMPYIIFIVRKFNIMDNIECNFVMLQWFYSIFALVDSKM